MKFCIKNRDGPAKIGQLLIEDKIVRTMRRGEMPFIGTTMLDHYGLDLIEEYLLEHSSGRARR